MKKSIEITIKIHEKSSVTRFNQHWTAKSQLDSGIFGVRHQEGWLLKRSKTLHVWRRRWASLWDETKTGWFLPINSRDRYGWYPLVNQQLAIENGPVEIVDLPIDSMLIFHSYVNVYQRVYGEWCEMLNHDDMKWLEMVGVLKKSQLCRTFWDISIISPQNGWLNIPWNHGWLLLGGPKLCRTAGPRSTALRSARLLFSPEKKMYNETSCWVVVKDVRVAGSVFVWGWET